ncbi:MAG: NADP-dependent malic enzyme [Candidatus Woesearchaeota archaeon]|nr:NADP-dependent malic enzyme [Candidatus Woesearchaeota archaeon]
MYTTDEVLAAHKKAGGKLAVTPTVSLATKKDLSIAYTPGVAEICRLIAKNPSEAYEYTIKKNAVAVVTDGSAVLGLGNIGPEAALPVMEGKAILFKQFGGVDAYPICLNTQNPDEIVSIVKAIAPGFGGINLEDISAPRCFEIEEKLQDIGIPVLHDDQHGTAIVVLAGLLNACKVTKRKIEDVRVVINGAGAAGTAICNILTDDTAGTNGSVHVKDVIVCDTKGIIGHHRKDLPEYKKKIADRTNTGKRAGTLQDALKGADVFIGVSAPNVLSETMIKGMNNHPIIFAMANPVPEIMPDKAHHAGAAVVATGRSDFPNQVNNALVFPGLFRGALDSRIPRFTPAMKIAAAYALAACVTSPTAEKIVPTLFEKNVALSIAAAVGELARKN